MRHEYKTKPRSMILEYMKANQETRFTARDVLEQLNAAGADVDKTTVYRNLERMCQSGELMRFKEADLKAAFYQYSGEQHNCHSHMHGQCAECGKIIHLDSKFAEAFIERLYTEYGLEVSPSKTSIVGVCKDCRLLISQNPKGSAEAEM